MFQIFSTELNTLSLDVVQQFIKYVKVHTTSKPDQEQVPSTKIQFNLAKILEKELQDLGFSNVSVNEYGIVVGTLPATIENKKLPTVCFFAHMDTSPDESGENVQPRIIKSYDGSPIKYPNNPELILSLEDTPALKDYLNSDIIVSDGTTLLGADDKAGVAEIMTAMSKIISEKKPHGTIKVVFTPDEEVGTGVLKVDVKQLQADFGYTMDGDELGSFEYENFNAASGFITIKGYNVHPGYAKNKMKNSMRLVPEILAVFPNEESPEHTEGKEGFYHIINITGDVNETKITFIIRNFDYTELQHKITYLESEIAKLQAKYPDFGISLSTKESYKNMKEILDKYPHVVEIARDAIKRTGIKLIEKPIRGGTDGARISYEGLPTPNIFAGGLNFHSKKEFVPVISLEKAVEVILNIVDLIVEQNS